MSEPQLERSVLEAKEREELFAIAEALGTKPGSRAKKSDLIEQILRATGVIVDSQPAATAAKGSAPAASGSASASASTSGGSASGSASGPTSGGSASGSPSGSASGPTSGPADGAEKPRRATRARKAAAPAAAGPVHDQGDLLAEADAGTAHGSESSSGGDRVAARGEQSAAVSGVSASPAGAGAASAGRASSGGATSSQAPNAAAARHDGSSGAHGPGGGPAAGSGSPSGGSSGAGGSSVGAPPNGARINGQAGHGPAARGERDRAEQHGDHRSDSGFSNGRVDDTDADGNANYAGRGTGQPGPGGGQQGPGQQGAGRFDGDLGNRRNRRRRGRDRGSERAPGSERDLQAQAEIVYSGEPVAVKGFLDLREEGYGFLRTRGYLASSNDVYVSISQVRRFALRKGDEIEGGCRPAGSTEKYPALLRIDTVSGLTPDEARLRPRFEDLTPLFPDQKLNLETPGDAANLTARIVDLISPIGRGQRGLIVSPPKAGKTTVLKQIAHSIETNNPEVVLMVLLVDERPEEVTDMRRSVKGEVIASTFDRPAEEHTAVAELTMERAKRLVERGKDVVIVLDGITRLARAYNLAQPASGRVMSGGIDTGALYPPKKFFGSARNIEEGGSLTILATALVETGSRMDEVIFEEFKGTGNMELRLDRKLAERRLYPALDVNASSTRHEELLFDHQQLQSVWKLRRVLTALANDGSEAASLQLLMDKIRSTKSNAEFLAEIAKTPAPAL